MAKLMKLTEEQTKQLDKLIFLGAQYKKEIIDMESNPNRSFEENVRLKKFRRLYKENSNRIDEIMNAREIIAKKLRAASDLMHEAYDLQVKYGMVKK